MAQIHPWPRRHPADRAAPAAPAAPAETAITAADRARRSYSACVTDRCAQGRRTCPTPRACAATPQQCGEAYLQSLRQPAEACTDIGADQQPERDPWAWLTPGRFWKVYAAFLVCSMLAAHIFAR